MYIYDGCFPHGGGRKKDKRCRIRRAGIFCAGKSIRLGGDPASRADKKVLQFISWSRRGTIVIVWKVHQTFRMKCVQFRFIINSVLTPSLIRLFRLGYFVEILMEMTRRTNKGFGVAQDWRVSRARSIMGGHQFKENISCLSNSNVDKDQYW